MLEISPSIYLNQIKIQVQIYSTGLTGSESQLSYYRLAEPGRLLWALNVNISSLGSPRTPSLSGHSWSLGGGGVLLGPWPSLEAQRWAPPTHDHQDSSSSEVFTPRVLLGWKERRGFHRSLASS